MSLWTVRDASTALLMSAFHRRLRLGGPPTLALQSAQTWLRTLPKQGVAAEMEELRAHLGPMEEPVLRSLDSLRSGGDLESLSSWKGSQPAFRLSYFWAPFILVGGG